LVCVLVCKCAHMRFPLGMWVDLSWCACVCVWSACVRVAGVYEMRVGGMHESRVPGYGHGARVRRGVFDAINTRPPPCGGYRSYRHLSPTSNTPRSKVLLRYPPFKGPLSSSRVPREGAFKVP
jgi:hypothetical protein